MEFGAIPTPSGRPLLRDPFAAGSFECTQLQARVLIICFGNASVAVDFRRQLQWLPEDDFSNDKTQSTTGMSWGGWELCRLGRATGTGGVRTEADVLSERTGQACLRSSKSTGVDLGSDQSL